MRRVLIVGSTGSIGTQALDVIERSGDLEVVGLAALSSWEQLLEQATRFGVERIALADPDAAARAAEHSGRTVLSGQEGLVIVDISDPAKPRLASQWDLLDEPTLGEAVQVGSARGSFPSALAGRTK